MTLPPRPTRTADTILHASCVAVSGKAVLIRGASGLGKSSLALELMGRGAFLVADDRTCLIRHDRGVIAFAPAPLLGKIEARYIGILKAKTAPPTLVSLVIDLDHIETERLPPMRHCDLLGHDIPLLHKVDGPHFPAAVLQMLTTGRWNLT